MRESLRRMWAATRSWNREVEPVPGVRVKDGESFERALRRFKRRCDKAQILADLHKHSHFEKPDERKKRKKTAARRKLRKLKLKSKERTQ